MSISNLEEITCPCGEVFEAELVSAISVSDNPELRDALLVGDLNLVKCPKCGQMFYAECFILYHDSQNELIAFVYPLSFQNQAAQCKSKMLSEFGTALDNFSEKERISYEPLLLFGIEDLLLTIKAEQEVEDEEMVLKYLAPSLGLLTFNIAPSFARKHNIPKVMPILKTTKEVDCPALISAIELLLKHNPNLLNYVKLHEKISKHQSLAEEIKKKVRL